MWLSEVRSIAEPGKEPVDVKSDRIDKAEPSAVNVVNHMIYLIVLSYLSRLLFDTEAGTHRRQYLMKKKVVRESLL